MPPIHHTGFAEAEHEIKRLQEEFPKRWEYACRIYRQSMYLFTAACVIFAPAIVLGHEKFNVFPLAWIRISLVGSAAIFGLVGWWWYRKSQRIARGMYATNRMSTAMELLKGLAYFFEDRPCEVTTDFTPYYDTTKSQNVERIGYEQFYRASFVVSWLIVDSTLRDGTPCRITVERLFWFTTMRGKFEMRTRLRSIDRASVQLSYRLDPKQTIAGLDAWQPAVHNLDVTRLEADYSWCRVTAETGETITQFRDGAWGVDTDLPITASSLISLMQLFQDAVSDLALKKETV